MLRIDNTWSMSVSLRRNCVGYSVFSSENFRRLHVAHWQHLRHVSFFLDLSLTSSFFLLFSFPAALRGRRLTNMCVVTVCIMVVMMIGILLVLWEYLYNLANWTRCIRVGIIIYLILPSERLDLRSCLSEIDLVSQSACNPDSRTSRPMETNEFCDASQSFVVGMSCLSIWHMSSLGHLEYA